MCLVCFLLLPLLLPLLLLISCHDNTHIHTYIHTQNGPRPDAMVVALQEALDSLQVLNWGLFG